MLGRPRYISETRPAGSDSPKCLTLVLVACLDFRTGLMKATAKAFSAQVRADMPDNQNKKGREIIPAFHVFAVVERCVYFPAAMIFLTYNC